MQADEDRLQRLIHANEEASRYQWARRWRDHGKRVIGILDCQYVPEEIVDAAGMLPVRISGTWKSQLSHAHTYRPPNSCLYCTHVLESIMDGTLSFLAGIVATNRDDDMTRLYDVCAYLGQPPVVELLQVPENADELDYHVFARSLIRLYARLCALSGEHPTYDRLADSIVRHNRMRRLLSALYELRKLDPPALSGSEVLGLTTAATVMPKDDFASELEALLPYISTRRAPIVCGRPRLLVSSEMLDNPAHLKLVEDSGCVIVMDDLDTGSRYFWEEVEVDDDPVLAIARRYLRHTPAPRMYFWDKQLELVCQWIEEYRVDGVVHMPQLYSYPSWACASHFGAKMERQGVPFMTLLREYHVGQQGQLQTRVQAFLEMMGSAV